MFRGVGRCVRLAYRRRRAGSRRGREGRLRHEVLLTVLLGLFAAGAAILFLGRQMRPLAASAAKAEAENMVHALVEQAVMADLEQRSIGYSDFVDIQRDSTGAIAALTTDMAAMNRLRSGLLEQLLQVLGGIRISDLYIPMGSLLDIDILWAKGPSLKVHSMSVGTVSAEFESEFTGAGVNQTLHRIWLEVCVPLTLILPGDRVETQVTSRLCVAETVIVGEVPQSYLQLAG